MSKEKMESVAKALESFTQRSIAASEFEKDHGIVIKIVKGIIKAEVVKKKITPSKPINKKKNSKK